MKLHDWLAKCWRFFILIPLSKMKKAGTILCLHFQGGACQRLRSPARVLLYRRFSARSGDGRRHCLSVSINPRFSAPDVAAAALLHTHALLHTTNSNIRLRITNINLCWTWIMNNVVGYYLFHGLFGDLYIIITTHKAGGPSAWWECCGDLELVLYLHNAEKSQLYANEPNQRDASGSRNSDQAVKN